MGILVDIKNGKISIPEAKLLEITKFIRTGPRNSMHQHQLQSLLGILLYIDKCVVLAFLFVNRLLQVLRNTPWAITTEYDIMVIYEQIYGINNKYADCLSR